GLAVYADLPVRLARFAGLAFRAVGDEVAEAILDDAAVGLAVTLATAMENGRPGAVVVAGGLLTGTAVLPDRLAASLGARLPAGGLLQVPDGLVGAAVLGLRQQGFTVDADVFARLADTVATHRRST